MSNKPDNVDEILEVMREYNSKKGFNLSDATLSYLAEDCWLQLESRKWAGIKWWPAAAKRWVLNNVTKWGSQVKQQGPKQDKLKKNGPSVREQLLNDL